MAFGSKNKVDPTFNMSSMTDMIFLLLIFFMLTSNFVTPSGLDISLPTSKSNKKVMPKINIGITSNLDYYINEVKIPFELLEEELIVALEGQEQGVVVLSADKDVPLQYVVNVAGIAAKLNAKVSLSTKPD